jgi:hypothetical protein
LGRSIALLWARFTDLGLGAVLLVAGVVVVAGIGLAVVQGRSGPDPVACEPAAPYVQTIQRMDGSKALHHVDVTQLHQTSAQLATLVGTARGDDAKAITDAAALADSAAAGQAFDVGKVLIEFDAACLGDGAGGGGAGRF